MRRSIDPERTARDNVHATTGEVPAECMSPIDADLARGP